MNERDDDFPMEPLRADGEIKARATQGELPSSQWEDGGSQPIPPSAPAPDALRAALEQVKGFLTTIAQWPASYFATPSLHRAAQVALENEFAKIAAALAAAPRGPEPSEAAIEAACRWWQEATPGGELLPISRTNLTAALRVAYAAQFGSLPAELRDCPLCGAPESYGHVCPERRE